MDYYIGSEPSLPSVRMPTKRGVIPRGMIDARMSYPQDDPLASPVPATQAHPTSPCKVREIITPSAACMRRSCMLLSGDCYRMARGTGTCLRADATDVGQEGPWRRPNKPSSVLLQLMTMDNHLDNKTLLMLCWYAQLVFV
jgi:hypothetical protein